MVVVGLRAFDCGGSKGVEGAEAPAHGGQDVDTSANLAELLTSVVLVFGVVNRIATLIIGVLLAVAAVELGHSAVDRLLAPVPVQAPIWMIVIVVLMAGAKELLARFSFELGRQIGSDALAADGWHHRSDVFATLLVAAAFVASRFGIHWLDGAAGIGVALIVAAAAYHIIAEAAQPLIGEHPGEDEIAAISRIAEPVAGVRGVHDILVQRYGTFKVISLHVVVSRTLTAVAAHDIGQAVESALERTFHARATVHVDPAPPAEETSAGEPV